MRLMGVSLDEVRFTNRGFPLSTPEKTRYLESIAETFLVGYHRVIETANRAAVAETLETKVEQPMRGFAYEGAAMGFTIFDLITPWKRSRLADFVNREGDPHHYMSIVGAGWAYARLKRKLDAGLDDLDPVFGWLVMDGFGFHEGFFYWETHYQKQVIPSHMSNYTRRVFDQGLGRALWFVGGADIPKIEKMICDFPPERRPDFWAGVGLAATYAGGVTAEEIRDLQRAASEHRGELGQGSVFAAAARVRAGNVCEHNVIACDILANMTPHQAKQLVDDLVVGEVAAPSKLPKFEILRRAIIHQIGSKQP